MAPKKGEAPPAGSRSPSRIAGNPAAAAAPAATAGSKRSATTDAKSAPAPAKKPKSDGADATAEKGKNTAGGQLKVGDPLPDLTLQDQEGKDIKISDLKKSVVFA